MKTKAMLILSILLSILLSSFTLTACDPFKGLRGYGQEAGANGKSKRFKNARGEARFDCQKGFIHAHEGNSYLEKHGLPREIGGNFICDGDAPKLPKDCQGREIRSEAELNAFTTKLQLPLALNDFICKNGVPTIPVKDLEY
ncbi:Uncharacterised protein [Moraxella lacunata]|uniref:Lipoprotein n=1 Tax=Moraxella lacunata TaxID=477 RepID=A0A378TRI6_MORLA|nr:hypothetical protein [Moraxella lacunata]STZ63347.1 Uncharacterised protein [Moraxella lacunata]